MGTRHLIAAVIDGEYRLAQYGQWDGYPEGQGLSVLEFLRDKMDRSAFEAALRNCHFIGRQEKLNVLVQFGADPNDHYRISLNNYDRFSASHPEWSRDTGAKILSIIHDRGGCGLEDDLEFAADSLFCEWAYVIDFDHNTFEVYEGFNKQPLDAGERFSKMEGKGGYYPVRLRKLWPLDNLPTSEDFLAKFQEPDGEESDGEE